MFISLIELVATVTGTAPGGVIVFFPSFSVLSSFITAVQEVPSARANIEKVLQAAPVFCETQQQGHRGHQTQPNGRVCALLLRAKSNFPFAQEVKPLIVKNSAFG